jgi:hypothetical protein
MYPLDHSTRRRKWLRWLAVSSTHRVTTTCAWLVTISTFAHTSGAAGPNSSVVEKSPGKQSSKSWRVGQEEDIQFRSFLYLFRKWHMRWPKSGLCTPGVLGVNSANNPTLRSLKKRLRMAGLPLLPDPIPEGMEHLWFSLSDLKWIERDCVQIRATVSHHRSYDPTKPIPTEGSPEIYYGLVELKHASNKWFVRRLVGNWEQPE